MTSLYLGMLQHLAAEVLSQLCILPVNIDFDERLHTVPKRSLIEINGEILSGGIHGTPQKSRSHRIRC